MFSLYWQAVVKVGPGVVGWVETITYIHRRRIDTLCSCHSFPLLFVSSSTSLYLSLFNPRHALSKLLFLLSPSRLFFLTQYNSWTAADLAIRRVETVKTTVTVNCGSYVAWDEHGETGRSFLKGSHGCFMAPVIPSSSIRSGLFFAFLPAPLHIRSGTEDGERERGFS